MSKNANLMEGPILPAMIRFSVPLLIGNIFQQLYNTVDSIVVGNFVGSQGLAAVGATSPIINMLVGLFMGLSTGGTVVISQYFGAKDEKKVHDAVHTALMLSLLLGIVLSVIGVCIVPLMLKLMNTPSDVIEGAEQYLTIYYAGLVGLTVYNMGSGLLRAVGDSKRPLYFLLFSSLLNIVLDLTFVIFFHMGVAGVAWATIISQFASAFLVLLSLARSREIYRFIPKHLKLDMPILKRIFDIGMPAGLQMAITSFSNVFVQGYINAFGSDAMAGWSAYQKIDSFVLLPVNSLAIAITTFVGQNVGARQFERTREGMRKSMFLMVGVSATLTALMLIFARPLVALFNHTEGVLYYGTLILHLNGGFLIVASMSQCMAGTLRGFGDSKGPMILYLASYVAFRQIYLFIVSHLTAAFQPIVIGYPLGWCVACLGISLYYRRVSPKYLSGEKLKL